MALEEWRKEGAREAPDVAPLRPESEPGTDLAAQTEVVDELGPDQGQKVEMPARLSAPMTPDALTYARFHRLRYTPVAGTWG